MVERHNYYALGTVRGWAVVQFPGHFQNSVASPISFISFLLSFEGDPYSIVSDGVLEDVGKSSAFCK